MRPSPGTGPSAPGPTWPRPPSNWPACCAGSSASLAEAAALTRDALALAVRLDMPGTVAAAGRLAAEIAAERDEVDPLTAREREVAEMVADALTNRQIAERLVLSERTVESHVRSILAKTGCANRTEFTARWADARAGRCRTTRRCPRGSRAAYSREP